MPIKSFRGLIAEGTQDIISLHTNTGSTGYKIVKFELMPFNPGSKTYNSVVKIYSIPQEIPIPTSAATMDFSDNTLLAAGYYEDNASTAYVAGKTIIFDNTQFNQDIYVTYTDNDSSDIFINYYIELEQVKLSLDENTVATLKDIRNITSR
tara:strand:- start:576 stop:1028 length:453 start_codon:yes stop_codon:yes gene_type:complete